MIASLLCAVMAAAPITLEEVRVASRQNLDALRAEIEVRRQQLGLTVAKAAIFPQLSVSSQLGGATATHRKTLLPVAQEDPVTGQPNYFIEQPSYRAGNIALTVSVNQLIYDGGRWWNQIALTGAQNRAAEGQLEEQRLVSELEAVSRFYQLLTAQFTLGVLENAVKRSETQLARADNLFEAARGAKLDAIDATVNLNNDRISVLRQRQVVTAAQVELLKWLGLPTHEVEAVDPAGENPPAPNPAPPYETVKAAARRHRPLLVAMDAQVEAAEKAVDIAWAPFLPSVSVGASYQRQGNSLDPFFTHIQQNNTLTGGFNFSWNVFNGFGNQAQLQTQRENLSQSRLQRERAELDLDGDLRRALKQLETQLQIAQIATDNLRMVESAVKLAEERFTQGAGSTLEVRDAQVKLINAQLSRLQARVDVEIARAALKRVVGAEVEEVR